MTATAKTIMILVIRCVKTKTKQEITTTAVQLNVNMTISNGGCTQTHSITDFMMLISVTKVVSSFTVIKYYTLSDVCLFTFYWL